MFSRKLSPTRTVVPRQRIAVKEMLERSLQTEISVMFWSFHKAHRKGFRGTSPIRTLPSKVPFF